MKLDFNQYRYFSARIFLIFFIISSHTYLRAQEYIATYSTNSPTIDGQITAGEWQYANTYSIVFYRTDGNGSHTATLYLQNDSTWLYVGVESGWSSGWDVYMQLRFDGNNDDTLTGNSSEPHMDIQNEYPSPGGWGGYDGYYYIVGLNTYSTTPPIGTQEGSYSNTNVNYEFKIKITDLNLGSDNIFGFYMLHGTDGTPPHNYEFPVNNTRDDPSGWHHVLIASWTSCPGNPTVIYEGKTYNTIEIGCQCWLRENLDVGTMINGNQPQSDNAIIEKYCYGNNSVNCDTYGGLYQWNEVMQYTNIEGTQGICPPGWHVPTDDEWKVFEGTVDSIYTVCDTIWDASGYRGYDIGKRVKSTTGWYDNGNGTNTSGFSALPGGYNINGYFDLMTKVGYFWSSTELNSEKAWERIYEWFHDDSWKSNFNKQWSRSVRCLHGNVNHKPDAPQNPSPSNSSTGQPLNIILSWSCSDTDNDTLSFDVLLGSPGNLIPIATAISDTFFAVSSLQNCTGYNWQIVAHDNHCNCTNGPVWSFTTIGTDTVFTSITASANPVCDGDTVCFTVSITNGGSNPSVQWFVNGTLNEGLIAWYPFNGNANDESGNGNNGTLNGATLTTDRFGHANSAYIFDGVDDYIVVPHSPTLNFTDEITVSYWIKIETSAPYFFPYHIIEKYGSWGGGQREWDINFVIEPHGDSVVWCTNLAPDIYYYFTMTFDGLALKLYRNGILVDSKSFTATIQQSTSDVMIGQYLLGGSYYLDGTVDDIRIFNRALDQSEILGLYHEGDTSFCYVPANNDTVYCVVTSSDSCIINNPDTSNMIIMLVETCNPCPGIPTVDYEGKTYNTVQIGDQCWLKENLDVGTMINNSQDQSDNGIVEKYCYNNNSNNCDTYGGLYQWQEIMGYLSLPGSQGICPDGWHIPTDEEFKILEGTVDSQYGVGDPEWDKVGYRGFDAGKNLKSIYDWDSNGNGTDSFGYTALPSGMWYEVGNTFRYLHDNGIHWSSSEDVNNMAWRRLFNYDSDSSDRARGPFLDAFSVRCLRDTCSSLTTSNAGPDQISLIGTSTTLAANDPLAWETGTWSIASGTGGTIVDPSNPGSTFNGTEGIWYELVWTISNSCNQTSRDTVLISFNLPCPGIPTVLYEGKTYNTVQIGTQCWLKENLNIGTRIDGNLDQTNNAVIEKYCYNNLESNCDIYGGLYQWNEMMQYVNTPGVQGICPLGWYIPTDEEWCTVTQFLDPTVDCNGVLALGANAGGKMKSTGTIQAGTGLWNTPNAGATNESGFTAIPGGYHHISYIFTEIDFNAYFWSSSEGSTDYAWYWFMFNVDSYVYRLNHHKVYGFSVRCLKDTCSSYSATGITISPSANPVCLGDSVTVTATPVNGGSSPVYQWKINGLDTGTNAAVFSYVPLANDTVICILTSNDTCVTNNPATSNEIIISIAPNPVIDMTLCWPITSRDAIPYSLRGGIPLNGTYSGTGVQSGVFYPGQVPIGQDTVIIRYTYTNTYGCLDSDSTILTIHPASGHVCGDPLTDLRDGQTYNTIQLGTRCWMAENLNFGTHISASGHQLDNCEAEKYCYNEAPVNCTNFGGLYQWDELMDYQDVDTVQGLCPPGWHTSSETDWQELISLFQDAAHAGIPLKDSGTLGFNGLLIGFFVAPQTWAYGASDTTLNSTLFWTSTASGQGKAWAHGLSKVLAEPTFTTSVSSYSSGIEHAFSVRCIRDD